MLQSSVSGGIHSFPVFEPEIRELFPSRTPSRAPAIAPSRQFTRNCYCISASEPSKNSKWDQFVRIEGRPVTIVFASLYVIMSELCSDFNKLPLDNPLKLHLSLAIGSSEC